MRILRHIIDTTALALIGFGFWLAWPPLAPIVVGGILLAASVYARVKGAR